MSELETIKERNTHELLRLFNHYEIRQDIDWLVDHVKTIYTNYEEKNTRMRLFAVVRLFDDLEFIDHESLDTNHKTTKTIQLFTVRKGLLASMSSDEQKLIYTNLNLIKNLVDELKLIKQLVSLEKTIQGSSFSSYLSDNFKASEPLQYIRNH